MLPRVFALRSLARERIRPNHLFMGRTLGFIGLLLAMGIGLFLYKQQIQATSVPNGAASASANPRGTIDTVGVKNDLIALANAERRRMAGDGKYVDIGDLISNGDVSMQSPNRGPFSYSSTVSDSGFRITASYSGNDPSVPRSMSIDENMQMSVQ